MFAASKTASASGDYQISRSLRFNSADSANLNKTFASSGNRRIFTLSFWLKRSRVGVDYEGFFASGNGTDQIRFENVDQLRFSLNSTASGDFVTTQVFRDVSAWCHIVFAVDTTQATSTNRVKIYVNGSQITSFTTSSYPTLNYDCNFNSNVSHRLGIANDTSYPFNGYMTETYLIDGQALTPSSFGETNAQTGVWQPKAYSGSYGTNGFYLNFSDNSNTTAATLGKDYSGNGNNWTPNNFSVTAGAGNDSLVDSPTSYGTDTGVGGTVRGNYSTLNPLQGTGQTGSFYITNSNLDLNVLDNSGYRNFAATFSPEGFKGYCEVTMATSPNFQIGFAFESIPPSNTQYQNVGTFYISDTGNFYSALTTVRSAYTPSFTSGDILQIAFDFTGGARNIWFGKNGTWGTSAAGVGVPATGTNPIFTVGDLSQACRFYFGINTGAGTVTINTNFGQRPFAYTAPSGFKALNTQNLPTPTIGATTATQAGKYFNPVLYTGTGSSLSVTGVGFQPDWVWVKSRSAATDHGLYDAVRGVQKQLESNTSTAETTETTGITAFNSDGFTTGALAQLNTSSATYVAWNWKANGSGSTNTAGQITSTVSVSTTSGFSIVTFTTDGTTKTVGHGLGVAPKLYIVKQRNGAGGPWYVFTTVVDGSLDYLTLNTTDAAANSSYTAPTSTVFEYNDDNAQTQVAYCFAEVAGYSKFGSYTGNGNTNRNFVYLGFTPALILVKRSSSSGTNWRIVTPRRVYLSLNTIDAEYASYPGPFLQTANGFEISGGDDVNENGGTFIYAAFASVPFKFSLAQ